MLFLILILEVREKFVDLFWNSEGLNYFNKALYFIYI